MSELNMKKNSTFLELRSQDILEIAKLQAESILKREYLSVLKEFEVAELPENVKDIKISDHAVFYDITKLVYTKEESYLDKLTTIANTVYVAEASLVTAIISDADKTRFLIGIVKKGECSDIAKYGVTLEGAVEGNFAGSKLEKVDGTDLQELVASFDKKYRTVSAISNIPSERKEDGKIEEYVQGIEKLVEALSGKKYCILTIADSISLVDCNLVRKSLSDLYKQLSGFAKTEVAINENYSIAESKTISESFAKSVGTNTSTSRTHTSQIGWSTNESDGISKSRAAATIAKAIGVVGAAATGTVVADVSAGTAIPVEAATIAAIVGSAVAASAGIASAAFGQESHNVAQGKSGSLSDAETEQEAVIQNDTTTESETDGKTNTVGEGKTLSFSVEDKVVKNILDEIDTQLNRINKCINYGAFNACTYILTEDDATNMLASGMFNALIAGEQSGIQNPKVNIWGENDDEELKAKDIIKFLQFFTHPQFHSVGAEEGFTASSLVNGNEIALQMGFPKKSISGLSVVYKVPFGRNVIRSKNPEKPITIGEIYSYGKCTKDLVTLDLKSLTSHVFITGSTGIGKSNAMYKILESIYREDKEIHFMVIEPAKGEYKHVFGNHPEIECKVYGTNPKKTELLKLNPFSFPEDVHVLEHVDRLVEIMNVCWPMYAAMPAILKNAVIKSYEKCGWDMTNSTINKKEKVFPSFFDVLTNINEILDSSAFSQDNKGDYTGALCTRVESLTYGLNGQIFSSNEIDENSLFEKNVIIDLSRIGAVDTKSLIMGILIMKLQEYRFSHEIEPNQPLRHVVVLEEAHNILRKTSTEQSMEGSNLTGKSVEMLTNAIAEMRTYGESFFIVDQAPELLDKAAIRNTNTKIVLRLPEEQDRNLVGSAMALNEDQILELSKLERGCAAVYQNDWEEAVLCQFKPFHKDDDNLELDKELFHYNSPKHIKSSAELKKDVLRLMLDVACNHKIEDSRIFTVERELDELSVEYSLKKKIRKIISNDTSYSLDEIASLVVRLYGCGQVIEKCKNATSIDEWNSDILTSVDRELLKMSKWYMKSFIQCLMIEQTKKNLDFDEFAKKWKNEMGVQ